MKEKFTAPRGTADILPEEVLWWQEAEGKARVVLSSFGYKEIRTPVFEETELFSRSVGQTSEIVQKQMLHLMPQGQTDAGDMAGAKLCLRPEGTAAAVRAYIQNNLDRKENLSKIFYIGPMFRGERPQKGRLRQFHQIGVEAIGPETATPYLDAEVIALALDILRQLNVKDFHLKINTLGSKEDKENFSKALRGLLEAKVPQLCPDCQNRFQRNVFRILDCKNKSCRQVVHALDIGYQHLSRSSLDYFLKVKEALNTLGIDFTEDPFMVRGLDYYTHTVFEITAGSLGSQDALGAGGRYNNLVRQLGGPEADAVGFALGMERILLAAGQRQAGDQPLQIYMIALNEAATVRAFQLLHHLRREGVSGDMSYKTASLKSQMRAANKAGARFVGIIGEEEMNEENIIIKDMQGGGQLGAGGQMKTFQGTLDRALLESLMHPKNGGT